MKIKPDTIFNDAKISLINTRKERFNIVSFTPEKKDGQFCLKANGETLALNINDEIILSIIVKYKFCPKWLVEQWYSSLAGNNVLLGSEEESKIKSFISFGLLYELPSAVAVFLMPTESLANLFGTKLGKFISPPYNTLSHTISEQQVLFECLTGCARYVQDTKCIPYVSQWGLGTSGVMCIPECDYSVRNSYFYKHIEEFNDQEAVLAQEILEGKVITTPDFRESKLTIHKKLDQYKYELKIPDLSVLAPRVKNEDGIAIPRSIALEVELTCKGVNKYERLLDLYWDNLKFGKVIYLVDNGTTRDALLQALEYLQMVHQTDGINKTCEFEIVEFQVPSMNN